MNAKLIMFLLIPGLFPCFLHSQSSKDAEIDIQNFVQVSKEYPFYFQLSSGETYIPVGANICWASDTEILTGYLEKLAQNGGNFARIWLNHPLFEIETEYGEFSEEAFKNIDLVLETAQKYNIRVKMCFESFRQIDSTRSFFSKNQYHVTNGGPFNNMHEYINSVQGRQVFLRRVQQFKTRYGNHPAVFGWELWNEMNAIQSEGLIEWNEYMLPKVQALFPKNLVLQSLGSFDHEGARTHYRQINRMPSNDVAQIHRYLDMGAQLDVCKAPMDELAADAINELRSYQVQKPMLLAEVGGVKPKHTGPIELYEMDKDGILLHDLLFAPFFAGAAGPGHAWHWDNYIDRNNLWYHFTRFNEAITGIDPVKEAFIPVTLPHSKLKVYALSGRNTLLLWCRDIENTWQNEFDKGMPPAVLQNITIDTGSLLPEASIDKVTFYDPWKNMWIEGKNSHDIELPGFRRSLVIKIDKRK